MATFVNTHNGIAVHRVNGNEESDSGYHARFHNERGLLQDFTIYPNRKSGARWEIQ